MAIAKLRGDQLRAGILRETHFAADAALPESILAINWSNHTEILQAKKVLYKVQLNDLAVGGLSQVDVTSLVTGAAVASTGTDEGIIVSGEKNKVTLRDGVTLDTPLKDEHAHIVYGRIVQETSQFIVKFYTDENGTETPYTMGAGQTIDLFFYKRGNMLNIPEDYAVSAGGNFVEGQTDAVALFDLEQLAKEIGITLGHDGNRTLSRSLVEEILVQTRGTENTTVRANTIIDEVVTARNGKASLGAELVAIRQAATDESTARQAVNTDLQDYKTANDTRVTAVETKNTEQDGRLTSVESKNTEQDGRLTAIEEVNTTQDGKISALETEVQNARSSMAKSADGGTTPKTFASVDARLEELEQDVASNMSSSASDVAALEQRIAELEAEAAKINVPDRYIFQASGNETTVSLPTGKYADPNTLVVTINGIENAVGIHYSETLDVNGNVVGIDFAPDQLVTGDIVIMRWVNFSTNY